MEGTLAALSLQLAVFQVMVLDSVGNLHAIMVTMTTWLHPSCNHNSCH